MTRVKLALTKLLCFDGYQNITKLNEDIFKQNREQIGTLIKELLFLHCYVRMTDKCWTDVVNKTKHKALLLSTCYLILLLKIEFPTPNL